MTTPDTTTIRSTVDSREHNSGMARRLAAFRGVVVDTAELPCVDDLLATDLVVERKDANDFDASSVRWHR